MNGRHGNNDDKNTSFSKESNFDLRLSFMTFFYFLKKYKKIGSDMQGWNTLNTSKHSPNPSIPFFDLWLLSPDNIGFCEKEYYSSDKNMFSSRKNCLIS